LRCEPLFCTSWPADITPSKAAVSFWRSV
jgi:hypothetical protein